MDWPLQEQQDRPNQVVEEALRSGPQVITVNNKEIAVVVPIQEYRRMHHPVDTLADFLMRSPLRPSGI
jgi:prevent-host-death family protein